jgi:hypothetical protein
MMLSERYRLAAEEWVDKDAGARLLEETKTTMLEQSKQKLIAANFNMADNAAERTVKASPAWEIFIKKMVDARTEANRAKVQLEYLRIKHAEQQSLEASKRAEMRL